MFYDEMKVVCSADGGHYMPADLCRENPWEIKKQLLELREARSTA
jgi:hypothetical protein